MSDHDYLVFLLIGALLIVIDGQVLYRNGRRFGSGSEAAEGMTRMVVVVFHLAALGVLLLLSLVNVGDPGSTAALLGKLGVLLLLLAAGHALTVSWLANNRSEEQRGETVLIQDPTVVARPVDDDSPVSPVPGQPGVEPRVSPSLEHNRPYSA